ncbi:MAG: hydroxyacid dehydrogenase, partial [Candidatus Zixiibacteriota bacterium]
MNRTEPGQPAILFLQDLGVDRELVASHLAAWPSPMTALWPDSTDETANEDVIALVTVNTPVDEALLARYPRLRIVSVAFTGYDCVDLEACRRRDIAVCNVPAYATDAVAELTLGLAVALFRKIIPANQLARTGDWSATPTGSELAGKTVGIIGTGAIGCRTAALFGTFKCHLLGWSRSRRDAFLKLGGEYVESLTDLFAKADIVSVHL